MALEFRVEVQVVIQITYGFFNLSYMKQRDYWFLGDKRFRQFSLTNSDMVMTVCLVSKPQRAAIETGIYQCNALGFINIKTKSVAICVVF